MPTENTNIESNLAHRFQRSEIVQEIISNKPGFLVRYGIFFLSLIHDIMTLVVIQLVKQK